MTFVLARIENLCHRGGRTNPTIKTLLKIVVALNINLSDLLLKAEFNMK